MWTSSRAPPPPPPAASKKARRAQKPSSPHCPSSAGFVGARNVTSTSATPPGPRVLTARNAICPRAIMAASLEMVGATAGAAADEQKRGGMRTRSREACAWKANLRTWHLTNPVPRRKTVEAPATYFTMRNCKPPKRWTSRSPRTSSWPKTVARKTPPVRAPQIARRTASRDGCKAIASIQTPLARSTCSSELLLNISGRTKSPS
mmetsp:Transcript_17798/g.50440  ORF Transcript_17798/g.50440 Transcript_17798/m.50440 type:complete len:205 (+) Transcript_17798:494-1108(+)